MGRIFLIGLVAGVSVLACRGTDDSAGTGLLQPHGEQVTPDVSGRYIVVYKPSVVDAVAEMDSHVTPLGVTPERVYQYAFRGWAGHISAAELANIQSDPHVAFVEADQVVRVSSVQTPTPSWGLDRIDQVSLPRDATYNYSRTGAGVHFYGIDTGILYTHNDFGGRASPAPGFDAGIPATGGVDCSGHGTHTASTAGGTSYGVAKGMTIIGVRVFDCFRTGSVSQIISGVDWVTQHAIKPAVASMSIEVPVSAALNLAVTNSIATGVVYVVAAGNDSSDACAHSPASTPLAITVGAIDSLDARAVFSNFGTCVDIFAPGVKTVAAVIGSNSAFQAASGTSMATPHVAGVVGLYLEAHPTATPAQVTAAILAGATVGHVSNPGAGSPNLLIYSGFVGAPGNQSPTATILAPASNATFVTGSSVSFSGTGSDPEDGTLTGASLVWTSSRDGQIGTGTGFSTSTLSVGTHTITLTVKDAQNATGSAVRSITITPLPNQSPTATITAPANNASFVGGTNVTFTGSGSDPEDGVLSGGSLVWTSSIDFQIGTGTTFSTAILSVGTHTITLTAKDAQNATGTTTRTITITAPNQSPSATITAPANNASFVAGSSVSFSGTGTDPESGTLTGASLVWTSSRDGQIGTGTGFSSTTLTVGTHTITLTAKDPQNATGTATRTITITAPNQSPTATITAPANNASFVAGSSVSFSGTGTDPESGTLTGASLVWTSSRDGQIGTGTGFSSTTLTVGTHTITLTAKDPQNATGTATRTITITAPNQSPTATITAPANNASFVAGSSVSFTGTGTDPESGTLTGASLVWTSSRDGQIGIGTGFSTSTLSVGTHTITLTAKDPQNATGTATRTITITAPVNQSPTATITAPANNASFVAGSSVSFSGTGTDPESGTLTGASLVWTSSRDGQIGTGTGFSTGTLSVGTHTITLTAKDPQNATGTATRTITITTPVNQSPTAIITAPANNASFVAGSSVSFSGTGTDPESGTLTGASLVWTSSRDGQIGTGTGFSTSTLSVGTHVITLTAEDPQNATGTDTRTITITAPINQSPTASIAVPANNASFVAGSSVSFGGFGTDPEDGALTGASLVWTSSRDGQIGTGSGFSTSSLSVGTHTITLTAKDAQNATGTASRTITITAPVNQSPTATITAPASNASFIAGSIVSFSGTGTDPESGTLTGASLVWTSSWDGQIGTGTGFSTSTLSVGTHVITLIAKDPQNATGTASRTITITAPVNQSPTATISTPASNASFVVGSNISFSGTGIDPEDGALGGAALTWTSDLQGQIGTGTSFSRADLAAGTHLITLTARDGRNFVGTATRSITITSTGNQAPVATITSPTNHGTFPSGSVVTFSGSGVDPEDGALVGSALVWTSNLQGVLGTGGVLSRNDLVGGLHVITLTVTDSGNAKGTATRSITIMVSAGQPQGGAPAVTGHLPR